VVKGISKHANSFHVLSHTHIIDRDRDTRISLGSDQVAGELTVSEILDRESKIDSEYRKECAVGKDAAQGSECRSREGSDEDVDSPCTLVNQGISSQMGGDGADHGQWTLVAKKKEK
jgi:hypothetical protein